MRTARMLIIAAVFMLVSASIFSFNNMNRQIGIIYLKNAAANYLTGQYSAAEEFLSKAEEFYSESSDYEYINGLIKLDKENRINEAVEHFKRALSYENWMLLEKKECVADLSRLLFRKKNYKDLIEVIENQAYPDYRDNDLMYLYILSLKNENKTTLYNSLLKLSIGRYSDDYRFAELYINENMHFRDEILSGNIEFKNYDGGLKVFLKAVMSLEDSIAKTSYLRSYIDRGGKDISAYIEYYRLTGSIDEDALKKLITMKLFEDPSNRVRIENILPTVKMREYLEKEWESYTGNVYYDFNRDGYFEELHLYESGKPVGMSIDNNQDGIIEVMIIFENSKPSELILSSDNFIRISYDKYPSVNEMSVSEGTERKVYTFLKNKLQLPVYEKRAVDQKLVYLEDAVKDFIADADKLKNESVRISSYSGGDTKDSYTYLKQELERRSESYSVLKIYNKIIGNYVYQQYNDRRTAGFIDIDYDNLIDLKETYTDGNLVAIEADDNKNGIYDYKLTFDEGFTISWWDFNEDGIYDCRQYKENDILVNEYSSALDGIFDIIERN